MKKCIHLTSIGFVLVILISGCSGYGKLRLKSEYGRMTIQYLEGNSGDYSIYYSGYSPGNASGIMFDLEGGNRTLLPSNRWIELQSPKEVSEIVSRIQTEDFPAFCPELYSLLGQRGEFYGYLYAGWHCIVTKQTDKNTLLVYNLPAPPQY
jgi:hypothetical protein